MSLLRNFRTILLFDRFFRSEARETMSVYEKHQYKSPAMPFLFHTDTRTENAMLGSNWHENLEILSFIDGGGRVRINAEEYEVTIGDIIVINSNCMHEFSAHEKMTYHVLIIDRAFFAENYVDTDKLHFSTKFRDTGIFEKFEELAELFALPNSAEWRSLAIRTRVMNIIESLCLNHSEKYDKALDEREELLSAIKRAIGIIHDKSKEHISLDRLAAEIGISKYYFAREFHRLTGYTPINYINITRCENAKLLLSRPSMSVMEIAEEVGYDDQSYFSRIFRRTFGITPKEYRKSILEKKD